MAHLVVGSPADLNDSEQALRDHLGPAWRVEVVDDDQLADADQADVVVVSKTVQSETVGTQLVDTDAGVLLWEDNLQMVGLMALVDDDGTDGTAWHAPGTEVHVDPDAPDALRAGRSGTVTWYQEEAEITFGPAPLEASTVVARLGNDDGQAALYVLEAGATLADGSAAAGRRAYVGLYDDTFRLLTPDGLALFDALLEWAANLS